MAPEQAQDFAIDGRADIYALGVALFEMLTGRHPFEGETPMSIVVKHITEPMPAPSEFDPAVPQALADLERAVALEPDNATVYSMQANRPWWLGDLDAALRAYDRFIQLEPDEWIGYLARAVLRFEVGDLTSSLDAWNKVAAIKPDSKYLPVGRGLVYEKLGQTELAEADYDQVREVSAGSDPLGQFVQIVAFSPQLQIPIPAYFDLSDRTGYRARGEVEKAFEHCGKALEVDPAYADALWKRGQLYADQGDWEAVTNDYTAAIEADASWPWFYYLRAQALAELGRIDEAQADLQQALELNPVDELRQQIDDFDLER